MSGGPLVDGQRARTGAVARLNRRMQRLLVSPEEREEADLERRLRALPGVSRPNTVAVLGSARAVGSTTSAFITATLLATHLKLRTIAVDAGPGPRPLMQLAPADRRCAGGLDDLLRDTDRIRTAAELRAYVCPLPSGLHVLGGPDEPRPPGRVGADGYGELVAFLSCFYEVVVLDLGAALLGEMGRFAAERADQLLLVTAAGPLDTTVLRALDHLAYRARVTVASNRTALDPRRLAIPQDEQLAATLAAGTYALDALSGPARVGIKRLGLAVAARLA